jgi:arsenate reductase
VSLEDYVEARLEEYGSIPAVRREVLDQLSSFIVNSEPSTARLLFVCTHNSRRSQYGQVWSAVAASHFGVDVESYSGGTEATEVDRRAVTAIERAGIRVQSLKQGKNPKYQLVVGSRTLTLLSKTIDAPPNPKTGFCAVMTCSQADAACPAVPGATARISLPCEDPKLYDGTELEAEKYDECCRQIAREMLYALSRTRAR